MTSLQTLAITASLLAASNPFMTFAQPGHLKHLQANPSWIAAIAYMDEGLKWNCLWAGLCLAGAVHLVFKG